MVQNLTTSSTLKENISATSDESLEEESIYRETPLTALSRQTLRKLSIFLNTKKILHSPDGYERDWRGLATLAEQRNVCDENVISGNDPTAVVIQLWCENKPETATIESLENFLGIIDRWDVIDDINKYLLQDFRNYQEAQQAEELSNNTNDSNDIENDGATNNTQDEENPSRNSDDEEDDDNIASSSANDSITDNDNINNNNDHSDNNNEPALYPNINNTEIIAPVITSNTDAINNISRINTNMENSYHTAPSSPINSSSSNRTYNSSDYGSDAHVLTTNDSKRLRQGLPLLPYDGFILYADSDYNHAKEVLNNLRQIPDYSFNFCLKDDLRHGLLFEHLSLMKLINERCNFLIVILSHEFNRSPENKFLLNYTQSIQIKRDARKILPLIYEPNIEVPENLTIYSCMRFIKDKDQDYWSKLADSLMVHFSVPCNYFNLGQGSPTSTRTTSEILSLASAPIIELPLDISTRQPPFNPTFISKQISSGSDISNSTNDSSTTYSTSASSEISEGDASRKSDRKKKKKRKGLLKILFSKR